MHAVSEAVRRGAWRVLTRLDAWANRVYGARHNPLYHSGAIVVVLLGVLIVTGVYLLVFYRVGAPWESVARISDQAWSGRWIRSVHRFAADAAVVAAAVHAFRMFAQHRSWGPRALAWVSGLVLLAVIFVCGWTGYVLIWDVQAHVLAVEGARFMDVLPIFSEPIGRTFVGERPMPSAFFFLNLFAHVALPIGVGLLLWIHVSRVARPVLLPARRVIWGTVGGLALLAIAWPIGMAPEADLFRLPADVPLDLFFAFWLPLTRALPTWSVWAAGGGLGAIMLFVPLCARPPKAERPARSRVDERLCTGCEQCVLDCPYEAITMVPRTDGRAGQVARVDPDACVSCGICIGSCAPMAVGPVGRTGRDQLAEARSFVDRVRPGSRDVVVVGCEWSAASSLRALGSAPLFPVACAGNVHTSVVEHLVRDGVGGVVVVACPEQDCRGREGGKWLEQRIHHGRLAELKERVDRRRVRIVQAAAGELALLRAELDRFVAAVVALDDAGAAGETGPADFCGESGSEAAEAEGVYQ
ncbi:MAG TPA: hydrogenase iron-sulfur subunit [Longimicrobiales bacterium]